jgi:hypothetical protein
MEEYSRIERARRRGRAAKAGLGALTALVFGVAFVGAKLHAPGQSTTGKAKALDVPSSFQRAVGNSSLQGGEIAPSVQAPSASSSSS